MPIAENYNPNNLFATSGLWNPDGSFTYPDGSIATAQEIDAARKAKGLPPLSTMQHNGQPAGNGPRGPMDPMTAQSTGAYGEAIAPTIEADAMGSTLDTSHADAERERLAPLLAQLQQQAATGGGAWEKSLADATAKASSSTQALGQSAPGVGYADALRNSGNAKRAVAQRAVGQGNLLREQAKEDATDQLSSLLAGQGAQDLAQATGVSDTAFGVRSANESIRQSNQANLVKKQGENWDNLGKVTSVMGAAMSDGGQVPGKAPVFGDDERNDVVPAKLSPGEIVIPRSHSSSPEAAAEFVRSLHARKPAHFAAGGSVGGGYQLPAEENGAILKTGPFDETRANTSNLLNTLEQRSNTPSPAAAQQMQNSTDANIAAAMQAHVRAPASAVVQATGAAGSAAAGDAAAGAAAAQQRSRKALAGTSLGQRDRELAMAQAAQSAAWRNTLMNTGISIADAALLRDLQARSNARASGIASGAGQGLAAWSAAGGGLGSSGMTSDDYVKGGPADLHDREDLWAGGEVGDGDNDEDTRARDFVESLRRRSA